MRLPFASVNQFTLSSCFHSAMHQSNPPSPSNGSPTAVHARSLSLSKKMVKFALGVHLGNLTILFLLNGSTSFSFFGENERDERDVTPQL